MLGAGRQNGGMTARIRPAIPAEAAALHELAALTFPLACPPSTTEASKAAFIAEHLSEAAFDRYLADPAREVVVAEDAGQLVGYTMVVHGEPADPDVALAVRSRPTAELSKLYVHPRHHGGGVASALVVAVVDSASRHDAASVWLGVNQHNARANRFYAKSGFETVGSKRFLVGDTYEDDWVRERPL
ncbi:MAG: GNAT family N-acetyltransferase [Microcella pacifica]